MQKYVALLMLSIAPVTAEDETSTYNPYASDYSGYAMPTGEQGIGHVCDDEAEKTKWKEAKSDYPHLTDCLCDTKVRALFEGGVPKGQGYWQYSESFFVGACPVPSCRQYIKGLLGAENEKTGTCICDAPVLFSAVNVAIQAPEFDLLKLTDDEEKKFKALCGTQSCYDLFKDMTGKPNPANPPDGVLPDLCPYANPSTLPPSPPVAINVAMTIAGDVASVNQDELKKNFAAIFNVSPDMVSLSLSAGSVTVDAQIVFADESKAIVAVANVASKDTKAMSASLGVTVTAMTPPSMNDIKPAGSALSGGAIAGIIVGAIAGVALLAIVVWYALKAKGGKAKGGKQTASSGTV